MNSLDPVRDVVLLEELDRGGTPILVGGDVVAVAREPRGIRLGDVPADRVGEVVAQLEQTGASALEGAGEVAGAVAAALATRTAGRAGHRGAAARRSGGERKLHIATVSYPATVSGHKVYQDIGFEVAAGFS